MRLYNTETTRLNKLAEKVLADPSGPITLTMSEKDKEAVMIMFARRLGELKSLVLEDPAYGADECALCGDDGYE